MSAGMRYGFPYGYWNVVGLQLAVGAQILLVALGVGAVLAASTVAFAIIKWFGVGYLLYLAWQQWQASSQISASLTQAYARSHSEHRDNPSTLVVKGFLVNASNPKAIVFMVAVLPQFIHPNQPLVPQYLTIWITMLAVDMLVMSGYTAFAARLLAEIRSQQHMKRISQAFSAMFAGAAAILATLHSGSTR